MSIKLKKSINILCIGLNKKDKMLLEQLLSKLGHPVYQVFFVANLKNAEPFFHETSVILINYVKTKKSWCEWLLKFLPQIPIILVAQSLNRNLQAEYLSLGVQDHIVLSQFNDQKKRLWFVILASLHRKDLYSSLYIENNKLSLDNASLRQGYIDAVEFDHDGTSAEVLKGSKNNKKTNDQGLMKKLEFLSTTDHLTQVANRLTFDKQLRLQISRSRRHKLHFALLLIDIDHFKIINDTLGHFIGDQLLQRFVTRIRLFIRHEDLLARVGGDEFAVLLDQTKDYKDAGRVATKLLRAIKKPFFIGNKDIYITLSIGIVSYPEDAQGAVEMLKNADMALNRIKSTERGAYQYYERNMDVLQKRVLNIEAGLVLAVKRKQFELVYQPIVNIKTGKYIQLEALIRWHHPELGTVPPDEFIPIAECSGKIGMITDWVIKEVCILLSSRMKQELACLPVSINLSSVDLRRKNLSAGIQSTLRKYNLGPELIHLEVTETAILSDPKLAVDELMSLNELGIKFSIDDFGTGYSSFSRLQLLPLYAIKIDRSFISKIREDENSLSIVSTIISLSKLMHFKTIAEGVETKEELNLLIDHGCDFVQGYYFAKPGLYKLK